MELHVFSREEIERGILIRTSYVVISISDPRKKRAKVKPQSGLRDVLFLAFHDAEPSNNFVLPPHIKLITPAQADQIRDFVHKHAATVGTIVVHCHQGMSRSPAVAAAISEALGLDSRRFHKRYAPNAYVHRVVADAFKRSPSPPARKTKRP